MTRLLEDDKLRQPVPEGGCGDAREGKRQVVVGSLLIAAGVSQHVRLLLAACVATC